MTTPAVLAELAGVLGERVSVQSAGGCLMIAPQDLLGVATRIKDAAGMDFEYLDMITAVDYPDCFELVYRFLSLKSNQSVTIKTSLGKKNPAVSSVTSLWKGADFQEREIYDLFGINFTGHPCLSRIMLWEGFQGHPLRKDYKLGT